MRFKILRVFLILQLMRQSPKVYAGEEPSPVSEVPSADEEIPSTADESLPFESIRVKCSLSEFVRTFKLCFDRSDGEWMDWRMAIVPQSESCDFTINIENFTNPIAENSDNQCDIFMKEPNRSPISFKYIPMYKKNVQLTNEGGDEDLLNLRPVPPIEEQLNLENETKSPEGQDVTSEEEDEESPIPPIEEQLATTLKIEDKTTLQEEVIEGEDVPHTELEENIQELSKEFYEETCLFVYELAHDFPNDTNKIIPLSLSAPEAPFRWINLSATLFTQFSMRVLFVDVIKPVTIEAYEALKEVRGKLIEYTEQKKAEGSFTGKYYFAVGLEICDAVDNDEKNCIVVTFGEGDRNTKFYIQQYSNSNARVNRRYKSAPEAPEWVFNSDLIYYLQW